MPQGVLIAMLRSLKVLTPVGDAHGAGHSVCSTSELQKENKQKALGKKKGEKHNSLSQKKSCGL